MPPPTHERPSSLPAHARLEPIIVVPARPPTYYARTPNSAAADKIARNLAMIARHPTRRQRCRRGCSPTGWDRWKSRTSPPGSEWRDVWPMPPATQ